MDQTLAAFVEAFVSVDCFERIMAIALTTSFATKVPFCCKKAMTLSQQLRANWSTVFDDHRYRICTHVRYVIIDRDIFEQNGGHIDILLRRKSPKKVRPTMVITRINCQLHKRFLVGDHFIMPVDCDDVTAVELTKTGCIGLMGSRATSLWELEEPGTLAGTLFIADDTEKVWGNVVPDQFSFLHAVHSANVRGMVILTGPVIVECA